MLPPAPTTTNAGPAAKPTPKPSSRRSTGSLRRGQLRLPRDAADIAALTRCRVIRPESLVWLEGYQALIRWRTENEITGLHAVLYDTETTAGMTKDYPLGR